MRKKYLLLGSLTTVVSALPFIAASCGSQSATPDSSRTVLTKEEASKLAPFVKSPEGVSVDTTKYQSLEYVQNLVLPHKKFNTVVNSNFDIKAKNRIYEFQYNTNFSENRSKYDLSYSSGSYTDIEEDLTIGRLYEKAYYGQPEIQTTNKLSEDGTTFVEQRQILKPSVTRWKLEFAESITLTVNGVDYIYNSDDAELLALPDKEDGTYSSASVELKSANPKSINHESFLDNLKKATKLSFKIRPGQFWVDNTGQNTKYQVKAEDFYLGFLRTHINFENSYRFANGGSAELDKIAQKIIPQGTNHFKENSTNGNKYLYDLYNISFDKLLNKNETVKSSENSDYFVVYSGNDQPGSFDEFFKIGLYGTYDFTPAPSQFINEVNSGQKELGNFITNPSIADADKKAYYDKLKTLSGIAKDSGIYWYGFSAKAALYSGKYYYKGYDTLSTSDEFVLNKNFFDKSFVENPRTVEKFVNKYTNSPLAPDAFPEFQYNQFISGNASAIAYGSLSEEQKSKIKQDAENYGLSSRQSKNTSSNLGIYFPTLVPATQDTTKHTPKFVNDSYAKLVWGSTLSEVQKGSAANTIKSATTGLGLEFKTILNVAVNWAEVASTLGKPNVTLPWISGLPQDVEISGNKADKSVEFNTLRPYADKLATLFVVDNATGAKVDLGGQIGYEIDPSESSAVGKSAGDQFKSDAYEVLKTRMKNLLDTFFAQNSGLEQKIKFSFYEPYTNINNLHKEAFDGQIAAIKGLDPRIEITYLKFDERDKLYEYWFYASTPFKRYSWGLDYSLVGSGIDGFSFNGHILQTFALIINDAEYKTKLQKSFPTFVKFAEKFDKYVKDNNVQFSIPLNEWNKLGNKYTTDFNEYLNSHKLNPQYSETNKTVDQLIPLTESDAKYEAPGAVSSKFWLWLNTKSDVTKAELLEFIKEYRNLTGVQLSMQAGTLKDPFSLALTNPNYVVPAFQDKHTNWAYVQVVSGDNQ
ncbi:OppA family ABC transporter substrate-binding lipoprotein [Mycoplasma leonicaptivi]|uniref:OppA family ABC transporter substrate-binding lipoprotein n=1 Tax=Mycoplasma leonicaptivi TaxID=36742 RepID=UPI0004839247|nr:variable surface lipoprotein [Mycoplasma leonicaptivi]